MPSFLADLPREALPLGDTTVVAVPSDPPPTIEIRSSAIDGDTG